MENSKSVLIGTFIKKYKILSFLEFLKCKFNLNLRNIFIYNIEGNDNEYIVSFKATEKEKYLKTIRYSTVLHVKNGSLFSINALNKLIEKEGGSNDNGKYVIDWNTYKNKLIILTNGELTISSLNKIEDKSILFN